MLLKIVYLLYGIYFCFLYPYKKIKLSDSNDFLNHFNIDKTNIHLLFLVFLISFITLPLNFFIACIIFSIFICQLEKKNHFPVFCSSFLGIFIGSFLPQWKRDITSNNLILSNDECVKVFLLIWVCYYALTTSIKKNNINANRIYKFVIFLFFALLILGVSLATNIGFQNGSFQQWHHWSAYVGQAQLISAGIIPLNDIPLQYGLGPLLSISFIGKNSWLALYWISFVFNILLTGCIIFLFLRTNRFKSNLYLFVSLLIITLCCLFWNSHQYLLHSVNTYPSVYGLRFLPSIIFLCLLVNYALNEKTQGKGYLLFHLMWMFCLCWSIESGIQASIIWFPYYIMLQLKRSNKFTIYKLAPIFIKILLLFLIWLGLFSVIFYYFFNELPILSNFFVFLKSLPAAKEKIQIYGPIWFIFTTIIIWLIWSVEPLNTVEKHHKNAIWLLGLMLYANFSYYLSHSHDIVILVLLPFFGVFLLALYSHLSSSFFKRFTALLLASLVGWSTLFLGWNEAFKQIYLVFNTKPSISLFSSPTNLITNFDREYVYPFGKNIRSFKDFQKFSDLSYAYKYIRLLYDEPVEVYDDLWLISSSSNLPPWNAFHGPINFASMPSDLRRPFLIKVAQKLNKPGWIIYDDDLDMDSFLEDYDSVYERSLEIDFETYKAIRFVPKK